MALFKYDEAQLAEYRQKLIDEVTPHRVRDRLFRP
jgi:hypothetical protein